MNGGHGYPATPLPTASDAKVFTFSCTILIPRSSDAFSSITRCFKSSGPHSCENRFALWRRWPWQRWSCGLRQNLSGDCKHSRCFPRPRRSVEEHVRKVPGLNCVLPRAAAAAAESIRLSQAPSQRGAVTTSASGILRSPRTTTLLQSFDNFLLVGNIFDHTRPARRCYPFCLPPRPIDPRRRVTCLYFSTHGVLAARAAAALSAFVGCSVLVVSASASISIASAISRGKKRRFGRISARRHFVFPLIPAKCRSLIHGSGAFGRRYAHICSKGPARRRKDCRHHGTAHTSR